MKIIGIFLLIVLAIVAVMISSYNRLVSLKARFQNAFAQIEVQLKRRYDLIPNLLEVAKKYMEHEKETFLLITNARSSAMTALDEAAKNPTAENIDNLSNAEKRLNSSLGSLNIQMEAYPDLKANTNMIQLHEELTSTENRVSFARQAFNDAVTAYNIQRKSIPTVFIAGLIGHGEDASLLAFEDSEEIQKAPKVSF